MLELGDWDLVHADSRYQPIHAVWVECGISDCGSYPAFGEKCGTCGKEG